MFAGETAQSYRVWLRTFGNWTQGNTTTNNPIEFSSYGLTLGLDRQINAHWIAGVSFGENNTSVKMIRSSDKDHITAFYANTYARRTFDQFFLDVEGNFGYNEHSRRKNATQWGVNGDIGTWWTHGLGRVEPYVRLSHICWNGEGSDSKETVMAGVRYTWRTGTELTTTVPRIYGGVLQELGSRSLVPVATFGNTPTVFPVSGAQVSGTRFFLGGGFTTSMGRSLDISLRYTAEMSARDTSHTALLGVNYNF
jgi:uncharacterized protein with beta-barrel porin domain